MSQAMTAGQLVAAYKRWHINFKGVTRHGVSWANHYRPQSYGDMHGQMAHHTGPYGDIAGMVAMLFDGRSDLPGPLCANGIAPDGTVYGISAGRANHAGAGGANVYSAVIADHATPAPGPDVIDGNAHFYGDEVLNPGDGKTPYPDRQVEALIRVHAARAEHHGWAGTSTIRHGGWTRRKIDTNGHSVHGDQLTQTFLQNEVDRALKLGPDKYSYPQKALAAPAPKPAPKPAPAPAPHPAPAPAPKPVTTTATELMKALKAGLKDDHELRELIRGIIWDSHLYGQRDLEKVLVDGAEAARLAHPPTS